MVLLGRLPQSFRILFKSPKNDPKTLPMVPKSAGWPQITPYSPVVQASQKQKKIMGGVAEKQRKSGRKAEEKHGNHLKT